MVLPGASAPLFSPSRIIHRAGLSFTEPPGLYHSAFPRIVTPGTSRVRLESSKRGVFPTRSVGRDPTLRLILVIMSELLYKIEPGRPEDREEEYLPNAVAGRPTRSPPAMVGARYLL